MAGFIIDVISFRFIKVAGASPAQRKVPYVGAEHGPSTSPRESGPSHPGKHDEATQMGMTYIAKPQLRAKATMAFAGRTISVEVGMPCMGGPATAMLPGLPATAGLTHPS